MTHQKLVEELRAIDGLVDVTGGRGDRPNFHPRRRAYLPHDPRQRDLRRREGRRRTECHLEPVWASTPAERVELLRRARQHARNVSRL
jgi:hypothetical protein